MVGPRVRVQAEAVRSIGGRNADWYQNLVTKVKRGTLLGDGAPAHSLDAVLDAVAGDIASRGEDIATAALKALGYLLHHSAVVHVIPESKMARLAAALASSAENAPSKEVLKMAVWCISVQRLGEQYVRDSFPSFLSTINVGLQNRFESGTCKMESILALEHLESQDATLLHSNAHVWIDGIVGTLCSKSTRLSTSACTLLEHLISPDMRTPQPVSRRVLALMREGAASRIADTASIDPDISLRSWRVVVKLLDGVPVDSEVFGLLLRVPEPLLRSSAPSVRALALQSWGVLSRTCTVTGVTGPARSRVLVLPLRNALTNENPDEVIRAALGSLRELLQAAAESAWNGSTELALALLDAIAKIANGVDSDAGVRPALVRNAVRTAEIVAGVCALPAARGLACVGKETANVLTALAQSCVVSKPSRADSLAYRVLVDLARGAASLVSTAANACAPSLSLDDAEQAERALLQATAACVLAPASQRCTADGVSLLFAAHRAAVAAVPSVQSLYAIENSEEGVSFIRRFASATVGGIGDGADDVDAAGASFSRALPTALAAAGSGALPFARALAHELRSSLQPRDDEAKVDTERRAAQRAALLKVWCSLANALRDRVTDTVAPVRSPSGRAVAISRCAFDVLDIVVAAGAASGSNAAVLSAWQALLRTAMAPASGMSGMGHGAAAASSAERHVGAALAHSATNEARRGGSVAALASTARVVREIVSVVDLAPRCAPAQPDARSARTELLEALGAAIGALLGALVRPKGTTSTAAGTAGLVRSILNDAAALSGKCESPADARIAGATLAQLLAPVAQVHARTASLQTAVQQCVHAVFLCLRRCSPTAFDTRLLAQIGPLLQASVMSGRRTLQNAVVSFWNATFGETKAELLYPPYLVSSLRALQRRASMRLPALDDHMPARAPGGVKGVTLGSATAGSLPDTEQEQDDTTPPGDVSPRATTPGSKVTLAGSPAAALSPLRRLARSQDVEEKPVKRQRLQFTSADSLPDDVFVRVASGEFSQGEHSRGSTGGLSRGSRRGAVLTDRQRERRLEQRFEAVPATYTRLDESESQGGTPRMSPSPTPTPTAGGKSGFARSDSSEKGAEHVGHAPESAQETPGRSERVVMRRSALSPVPVSSAVVGGQAVALAASPSMQLSPRFAQAGVFARELAMRPGQRGSLSPLPKPASEALYRPMVNSYLNMETLLSQVDESRRARLRKLSVRTVGELARLPARIAERQSGIPVDELKRILERFEQSLV